MNKLVTVRPLHRRYVAEIGDVVVGRVTEVNIDKITYNFTCDILMNLIELFCDIKMLSVRDFRLLPNDGESI